MAQQKSSLSLAHVYSMGLLFFRFFLVSLLSTIATAADDSVAMLKLATALFPTPSGWSTDSATDCCKWGGVKCDSSSRVISINLANKDISGTLPSELSTLSQLQSLFLQENRFSGPLPSLANLSFLQEIYLDNNNFTSIPQGCFQGLGSLQIFSISQNTQLLPWSFPSDFTQSTTLTTFEASKANLVGTVPDIISSLPSLQNLRLSYNNLTGTLPPTFANSSLQNLWLNNQQMGLSGTIDVLSSMTELRQVWLQVNQFTGPIPDLSNCKNLFDLQLRDNHFAGIVPTTLLSLPSLANVSLSNNKLQGPMPQFHSNVKVDINGINNFCVSKAGVPCDPQVTTLIQIAGAFGYPETLSDSWKGNNPCDNWGFISCDPQSNSVATMNLAKRNFGGTISPAFANLTALKNLYLKDNNLTGSIPDSLAKLTQLLVLDVSDNNLTGKIPAFASSVKLIATPGNPLLGTDMTSRSGGDPPSDSNLKSNVLGGNSTRTGNGGKISPAIIASVVIFVVIVIALASFVLIKYNFKKKSTMSVRVSDQENGVGNALVKNGTGCCTNGYGVLSEVQSQSSGTNSDRHFFEGGNIQISVEVLRQVTDSFNDNNILGKGGFGVVYKGQLHDGTMIAVKRMEATAMGTKGMNEFQAEIAVLTKVRHRHLVALLGYCIHVNEKLLVYEYMPQGTLAQHLFEWRDCGYPPLTWKQRATIALDVARGVEYLHSLAQQSFIHRDLKPSNILLGEEMRAKVADFGLVKNAPDGKYSMETRLAGTFGYLAPEYAATGRVTTKVDVYAFGVILMEIITGRKALDDTMPDEKSHLVTWFRRILISKNIPKAIDEILDPDEETLASIFKIAELAGHCTAPEPYQRPDMGHAVNILAPLVEQWKPTSQDNEETSGINLHMSLPEFLQRWQADEGTSTMFNDIDYSQSQSSIPVGFTNTFASTDCR